MSTQPKYSLRGQVLCSTTMEDVDGATRQDESSAVNTKDLMVQAQDECDIVSELMDR